MADLQQQLIWLGAGCAAEPALDFANFSKVTLIDAREEATRALTLQYSQANVQVVTQAVAATKGVASLQHYNLPGFSALTPATGLKQLFPGLKASQSENLTTKSINDVVSELNLSSNLNTLILDIPDQALNLLQALQGQQQLTLFNTIYLQYGNDELYEGMASFPQIADFFKQHYFALKQTDNTDPDLPVYCFTLDATAKDVALFTQQIKTLSEQLVSAEGQLSKSQQQAEQTKAELTNQLEQVKQQVTAEKQQTAQIKTEYIKQLELVQQQAAAKLQLLLQDKQQLEQQQAGLQNSLDEVQAELTECKASTNDLKTQLADKDSKINALNAQLKTEKAVSEQMSVALTELKVLENCAAELLSVRQQLEHKTSALNAAEQQLQHITQQQRELNDELTQIKQQYEQKLAGLTTQLTNTVVEKETLQQQFSAAKVAAEKNQADLNGQLTVLDAELKKSHQQLLEKDNQLAQFTKIQAQLEHDVKQEAQLHQKHKSWAESLKTQNEQLNKELKEQQRSSQLSIKLLAKVEADASELRERYSILLKTEQELRNLVGELYIKLSAASKFYNKLEQDHPELLEKKS